MFYSTFVFYSNGGNDPYHMSLNAFTTLLDDAGIPDPDSLSIKRSDCDTIFIVCNFQPDKNSPDVAVNDEHAMMRFEFMECIVRLGESAAGCSKSYVSLPVLLQCCTGCLQHFGSSFCRYTALSNTGFAWNALD